MTLIAQAHPLCSQKRRYRQYPTATLAAYLMAARHPGPWRFVPYACLTCHAYHIARQDYDESEQYFYSEAFTTPIGSQPALRSAPRPRTPRRWRLDET